MHLDISESAYCLQIWYSDDFQEGKLQDNLLQAHMVIAGETNCNIGGVRTVVSVTDHTATVFGQFTFRDLCKVVEESFCHVEV